MQYHTNMQSAFSASNTVTSVTFYKLTVKRKSGTSYYCETNTGGYFTNIISMLNRVYLHPKLNQTSTVKLAVRCLRPAGAETEILVLN